MEQSEGSPNCKYPLTVIVMDSCRNLCLAMFSSTHVTVKITNSSSFSFSFTSLPPAKWASAVHELLQEGLLSVLEINSTSRIKTLQV